MHNFGFNFGAFVITSMFFGGHKAYGLMILSVLLFFIPGVNLIWKIVCGIKGPQWAFNSSEFSDEEFEGSMETWNRGGVIFLVVCILAIVIGIIAGVLDKSTRQDEQDTLNTFLNIPAVEMQLVEQNT